MNKILSGSAVNYGSILPPLSKTTDGAMFYLVDTYTDPAGSPSNSTTGAIIRGAGLYTYVFAKDANATALGNQAGYMWVTVANMENFVKKLGDEMTGSLLMTGQVWSGILQIKNKTPAIRLSNTANIVDHQELRIVYDTISSTKAGIFSIQRRANENPDNAAENLKWLGDFLKIDTLGNISSFGNTVWHSGNDGAGTALDAGKLGGQLPAYYLDSANQTGTLPVTKGGTGSTSVNVGGVLFGTSTSVASTAAGTAGQVLVSNGLNAPAWKNASTIASGTATALATARQIELTSGVTGKISFDGSKDVQIITTVASVPWSSIADIADYGKTIQKKGAVPYTNIELSARPSYFYTYSILGPNGEIAVADMKPTHFPIQSITGFDAYNSDNQAVSAISGNTLYRVGLTVRGEEIGGARSMQLAANWNYSEESPFGGMFYRVNDDMVGVGEWGAWSQLVDATYLKRYNQEIKSSAPITASVVKAWDQNPSHGYVQMLGNGEVTNDPARYAGWIEYNARYPDKSESRLGWIGFGKYDYDNSKKTPHDSGQIVYTAKQHRFFGRIDTLGATTASSVAARSEPQLTGTVGGVVKEWDRYGSVQLDTAQTADHTGAITFFAGYDSPEVGRRRAAYIGNAGYNRAATNMQVGAVAAAPADNLGNLDYVAGNHHIFGNLHIHPDLSSTEATWSQVKMQVTAATGDISSVGRLFVGNPTTNSAGTQVRLSGVVAQVTGDAKVIGNLEVTGTITGAVSMTGIKVSAVNMNDNSVTTAALADDSVTRAKVADEAVGSAQMGINDLGNLCWNGKGDSLDGWAPQLAGSIALSGTRIVPLVKPPEGVNVGGAISTTVTTLAPALKSIAFKARDSWFGPMFNVRAGERYFCQMDTFAAAASVYRFAIGVECWDSSGNKPGLGGWFIAAERPAGTSGSSTIGGMVTIPDWVARARIWIQILGPMGVVYTDAGHIHYATNIIVRHATYANGSINPRSLMSIGDTTNMFTDYDFVENYWAKTSTSTVDGVVYTMYTDITAPALPDAFITPRVLRFSGEPYRTRPDIGTVLGTTYAAAVTQPTSALSRVYAGDELSLSYMCQSDGIATGSINVLLQWYDAKKAPLNLNSPYVTVNLPLTSPTRTSGSFVVPANACYAAVYIARRTTSNGATTQGWVDVGDIRLIQKVDASMISDVIQTNGNLIPFSETSGGVPAIGNGWSYYESNATDTNFGNITYGGNTTDFPGVDAGFWHPAGTDPFLIGTEGYGSDLAKSYAQFISSPFPVIANSRYEASVYVQSHRCAVYFYIQFYTTSNAPLWAPQAGLPTQANSNEPGLLSTWSRLSIFAVAPANAAYAKILMRKYGTQPGYVNELNQPIQSSYAWFLFPYMGLANATQTQPSAYSPGPTLMPTGGNISEWNKITTANASRVIAAGSIGTTELADDITFTTLNVTGAGGITVSGTLGVHGAMASNDDWGIRGGGVSNNGYLEIYTSDDGNEPIYVRQYTNGSPTRAATLLDAAGNTGFPGNVGSSSMSVSGTATVGALVSNGDVTAFSTSDRSIKSNIEVIQNALNKIDAISGVTFNRTDKEGEPREAGVIAQEIQAVLPEVVRVQGSGLLGVDYGKVVSLLIQGIKEQQIQIEMLKADIQELKNSR